MKLDPHRFERLVEESADDDDLAEDFAFFIEGVLDLESHDTFLKSVSQLPEFVQNAYLPWHADLQISSGGLPRLLGAFDTIAIRAALVRGLSAIGESRLSAMVTEAWGYEEIAQTVPLPEINKSTGDFHKRYFSSHDSVTTSVGCYLRLHKNEILMELLNGVWPS